MPAAAAAAAVCVCSLGKNKIGAAGATKLGEALVRNSSLTTLM